VNPEFQNPDIVVIGGGGGGPHVLHSLYVARATLNCVGLVGTADSGGSSGRMREQSPGMNPPGDAVKCAMETAPIDTSNLRVRDDNGDPGSNKSFSMYYAAGREPFGDLETEEVESAGSANRYALDKFRQMVGSTFPVEFILDNPSVLSLRDGGREIVGEINVATYDRYDPGDLSSYSFTLQEEIFGENAHDEYGDVVHISPELRDPELSEHAAHLLLSAKKVIIAPSHLTGTILPAMMPLMALSSSEKQQISGITTMVMGSENPSALETFTGVEYFELIEANSGIVPKNIAHAPNGIDLGGLLASPALNGVELSPCVNAPSLVSNDPLASHKPGTIHSPDLGRKLLFDLAA